MNTVKLTDGRKSLLQALVSGPKAWSELRFAYYGPERAKEKASTSFHNQLQKLRLAGIIVKDEVGEKYVLGPAGIIEVEKDPSISTGEFKSKAQLLYVPKPVVKYLCGGCTFETEDAEEAVLHNKPEHLVMAESKACCMASHCK